MAGQGIKSDGSGAAPKTKVFTALDSVSSLSELKEYCYSSRVSLDDVSKLLNKNYCEEGSSGMRFAIRVSSSFAGVLTLDMIGANPDNIDCLRLFVVQGPEGYAVCSEAELQKKLGRDVNTIKGDLTKAQTEGKLSVLCSHPTTGQEIKVFALPLDIVLPDNGSCIVQSLISKIDSIAKDKYLEHKGKGVKLEKCSFQMPGHDQSAQKALHSSVYFSGAVAAPAPAPVAALAHSSVYLSGAVAAPAPAPVAAPAPAPVAATVALFAAAHWDVAQFGRDSDMQDELSRPSC